MNRSILFPLPDRDFDVTEVAVPWKLLTRAGHRVVFATETGAVPACDPFLLRGVLFGQLGADREAKALYRELERDPSFRAPLPWSELDPSAFDALMLAGGHAPGMRQYLGNEPLRRMIREFWALDRPVAAICHGVLVLARAGLLNGRRTTCLPKYLERVAYYLTAWKLGRYYRTYDAYVEDEVIASGARFERGPITLFQRGSDADDRGTFLVEDQKYLSARWPGDAYRIARALLVKLEHEPVHAARQPSIVAD